MIIVIGKNSQIGKELKKISLITQIKFLSKRQLNVCKRDNYKKLDENKIKIIINLSAFTLVKIENENDKNKAFEVNVNGLKNLVSYCKKNNIHLIQISSDYVYKNIDKPKKEHFALRPLSYYAKTKYYGEKIITNNLNNYTIIRTSHLFSKFGNNIVSNVIDKIKNNMPLKMYENIKFNLTSTNSIAKVILKIIDLHKKKSLKKKSIFNFAQHPSTTPLKLATYIKKHISNSHSKIYSINYPDSNFNDIQRPLNSTLDTTKINNYLKLKNSYWYDDLKDVIKIYEI